MVRSIMLFAGWVTLFLTLDFLTLDFLGAIFFCGDDVYISRTPSGDVSFLIF